MFEFFHYKFYLYQFLFFWFQPTISIFFVLCETQFTVNTENFKLFIWVFYFPTLNLRIPLKRFFRNLIFLIIVIKLIFDLIEAILLLNQFTFVYFLIKYFYNYFFNYYSNHYLFTNYYYFKIHHNFNVIFIFPKNHTYYY